jgi:hypothetical protein
MVSSYNLSSTRLIAHGIKEMLAVAKLLAKQICPNGTHGHCSRASFFTVVQSFGATVLVPVWHAMYKLIQAQAWSTLRNRGLP